MDNNVGDVNSSKVSITEPSVTEVEPDKDKEDEPFKQPVMRQSITDPDQSQTENDTYLTTRNSIMIETLMLKKNMIKKICQ